MTSQPTAEQAPTTTVGALPEPSDLDVAVRVAQYMLTKHGTAGHDDIFALNQAYGAVTEALRLILRALDAEPAEDKGHTLTGTPGGDQRCAAAHPDDPTPCDGPLVVTVLDATNAGADGCEHHGARLLASLDGGRVYTLPDAPEGSAIRTFKAADTTRPFAWVDGPRSAASQLSRAEKRRGGEDR